VLHCHLCGKFVDFIAYIGGDNLCLDD